jgi:hypothetical protein
MIKFMLWPFVVTLSGLVLVAVFAKKGSIVSLLAKSTAPSEEKQWPWLTMCAVLIGISIYAMTLTEGHIIEKIILLYVFVVMLAATLLWALVSLLLELFKTAAPLAAEVGEELTDGQKRSVLRHGIRWFIKFRKW